MATCPDTQQLQRHAEAALAADEADRMDRHVAECANCARAIRALRSGRTLPEALNPTIAHDDEPRFNIDEAARRNFEAAWEIASKSGKPPEIEQHLPPPDAESFPGTAEELIHIDMEYRHRVWSDGKSGEPPPDVDAYLTRFPSLNDPGTRERLTQEQSHLRARYAGVRRDLPELPGYEILSKLGRGGMGVVYKARQLSLNRMVAVKMLPMSRPLAPVEFVRFQIEAEALATLQHPNIVQIHEVSERGGVPFLALELVEGGDLGDHMGPKPFSPRDAARLVETLARAMHAAHLRGIVHRDLKPSNVLMTKDGVPKISDFGLAKKLEANENAVTQTGAILGTPAYMSPEQAAGDIRLIGPGTDIYALGAMLYELLTCRPPHEGTSMWETVQMVRTKEPTSPRKLRAEVPRDLDIICLKCLEKTPAKRYTSAQDLAEDLRRYLADEPIRARPATAYERVRKWTRRHPTIAALTSAITLAAIVIASLGVWSYFSLREAARRAEERSKLAREVVDDMYTRVADEWLSDEPHRDALQLDFLQKAANLYEEFAHESGDDPARRREVAQAYFRLGQIHRRMHNAAEADKNFDRAIAIQESLRGALPVVSRDLAQSYNWRGEAAREKKQLDRAEVDYRKAIALYDAMPGSHELAAQVRNNLGVVLMDKGRPDESQKEFDQAIRLLMAADAGPDRLIELAHCFINRGTLYKDRGRLDKAEADDRTAIKYLSEVRKKSSRPDHKLDLALARQNLGNVAIQKAQAKETEKADRDKYLAMASDELTESLALVRGLAEDFPSRPVYRKKVANVSNNLAALNAMTGDFAAAKKSWTIAADLLKRLAEEEHKDGYDYSTQLGAALGNLGWLAAQMKDLPEARRQLEKAIECTQAGLRKNPDTPETRRALSNQYRALAEVAVQLGDHATASRAAKAFAEVFPDQPQDSYYAACFLARCIPLAKQDKLEKSYAADALAMLRRTSKADAAAIDRLPNESTVFAPLADDAEFVALRKSLDAK